MTDLISVIIPVYNVEKYLSECIDSVINQEYSNLDIIIIDDGSTDKSAIICDEYKELDSRIRVIHKINEGLSSARNYGLRVAKGDWICFIDSDDWIADKYVSRMYEIACKNDADIVVSNYCRVELDGTIRIAKAKCYQKRGIDVVYTNANETGDYAINYTIAWNKLYKKNLFNNVRFPEGLLLEDQMVTCKLMYFAERVVAIDEPLYYYRRRLGSIMESEELKGKRIASGWYITSEIKDFFRQKDEYLYSLFLKNYIYQTFKVKPYINDLRQLIDVKPLSKKSYNELVARLIKEAMTDCKYYSFRQRVALLYNSAIHMFFYI